MSTPADKLDAAINDIWGSDYVQKNPNKAYKNAYQSEYQVVAAYLNGGPRPDPANFSKMGRGLVVSEDVRRELVVVEPEPEPEPEPPVFSPERWVYDFGSPSYGTSGWSGNSTEKGYGRQPSTPALASKANERHIDYDASVKVMEAVIGNSGQVGQCNTMRSSLFPDDYDDHGTKVTGAMQHANIQQSGLGNSDALFLSHGQKVLGIKAGEEWWYGLAFRTNQGYWPGSDLYGNRLADTVWSLHNSLYGSQGWGSGANVQIAIGTKAPVGATTGTEFTWNTSIVNNHVPRLHFYMQGGNSDGALGAADQFLGRWIGPLHEPGKLYRIIFRIKWSATQTGIFQCWVNDEQVANKTSGVSNVYRRSSTGQVDTNIYPIWENYRAYNPGINWENHIYYGGMLKGSNRIDVTVP